MCSANNIGRDKNISPNAYPAGGAIYDSSMDTPRHMILSPALMTGTTPRPIDLAHSEKRDVLTAHASSPEYLKSGVHPKWSIYHSASGTRANAHDSSVRMSKEKPETSEKMSNSGTRRSQIFVSKSGGSAMQAREANINVNDAPKSHSKSEESQSAHISSHKAEKESDEAVSQSSEREESDIYANGKTNLTTGLHEMTIKQIFAPKICQDPHNWVCLSNQEILALI